MESKTIFEDMRGRVVCILSILLVLTTAGCSSDGTGTSDGDGTHTGADSGADAASTDGGEADADFGIVEGLVYLQGEVDHSGVSVTLDGTDQDTVTEATGAYAFRDVDPGTYTVTASLAGYSEETSSAFEVQRGETTTVDPLTLTKTTGELAGTVLLDGQSDHSGTVITVEGTSHTTVTDESGSWSVSGVAAGQYRIEATHTGYQQGAETDISVLAGQVTAVPPMTLVALLANGSVCSVSTQCLSGFCVDEVCCVTSCDGVCETCNGDVDGSGVTTSDELSNRGTCHLFERGADFEDECINLGACDARCDGQGACRVGEGRGTAEGCIAQGEDCSGTGENTQCATGYCIEGVCCDNACDGVCEACDIDGSRGTCTGYAYGDDPESECVDILASIGCGSTCSGTGESDGGGCLVQSCEEALPFHPAWTAPYTPCIENGDGTVTDELTGLMWMRCAAGESGDDCGSGSAGSYTWQEAVDYCENLDFAGHDEWRLPDRYELQSLVDYQRTNPAIDTAAFPRALSLAAFWSSSSFAGEQGLAWYVHLYTGNVDYDHIEDGRLVRCARLGPLDRGRFELSTLSGDRVVTDSATGLMWQGCPAGLSGPDCSENDEGDAGGVSREQAISLCDELIWGGVDDWRLPSVTELSTIVDAASVGPAIDVDAFPATPSSIFWSSSSWAGAQSYLWHVNFESGTVDFLLDYLYDTLVRCVRLGP